MLYSSADILRVLGGSEIIRLTAKLHIVDGRPPLTGEDGTFVYVDRYPSTSEFEATWKLWVIDYAQGPVDLVLAEIARLLPKVAIRETALGHELETTDFRSGSTQTAPEASRPATDQSYSAGLEERFQALLEDVQDQMLLVHSGAPGKDGRDGVDGKDGADGRDLNATEVELEELANVETGIAKEKGQVLTWDGNRWTNLHVPQVLSAGGAGAAEATGPAPSSIDDLTDVDTSTVAPVVGQTLKWDGSNWVPADGETGDADGGDFGGLPDPDAGNFSTGASSAVIPYTVDGGNFQDGSSAAYGDSVFDGGLFS